ncbi:hypothetical protein Poly51_01910 [Rubripirellula tenax]|uniref:CusB-like beta-barrel domain-containing protein n=1 Tax=Rubripirellula tenax TaxID=2528015 RepID=A0A5C6FEU6_9BACT|nr:HlyD family efflux transporter periplasmic adaptor subunit [Rubripirellula tenax]TWU59918.1 hypothetical protein Poly51_01910 [Rubripirellula tenax]
MTLTGANTTAPTSATRVSLAGPTADAMSAALDDAVAKLAAVAECPVSSPPSQLDESTLLSMRLLEAMAIAPSRSESLRCLVATLASLCPDATVRGGLGNARLTRFVDSRLGWLGPESTLQQKAAAMWDGSPHRRATDKSNEDQDQAAEQTGLQRASVVRRDHTIEIRLPAAEGNGRCVVWIDGTLGRIEWLPATVNAINAVLWGRPSRSLPTMAINVAKRSTALLSICAVLLALATLWPVPYRVACTARVETAGGRFVATPFEATLLAAHARPGDAVSAGQVLLELDGRPLRLEREALSAEIGQVSKEYDVALATRRIAEAQQAELRKKQLNRQLELITDRLGRLEVISPIDGIIVSGDLDKHIGSPLEQGQTLIEVAPLDQMRLEIDVPEHEIAFVKVGNPARVKINATGGPSIRMPLQTLHPQSELRDEVNVFVGSIDLENTDGNLRPGMQGDAIVYGPLRPWIWSWVRGGFERILWWAGY